MSAYAEFETWTETDFLQHIHSRRLPNQNRPIDPYDSVAIPQPKHLVTSDTFILSTDDSARALFGLVGRCGEIYTSLLQKGFLSRGAIVRGEVYRKGLVIFGKALTNAYLLEKTSARYPRILISSADIETLQKHGPKGYDYSDWFRRDRDGFSRLNPFCGSFARWPRGRSRFFTDVRDRITRALKDTDFGTEQFAKVHWLAEIFNEELLEISTTKSDRYERVDSIDLAEHRKR